MCTKCAAKWFGTPTAHAIVHRHLNQCYLFAHQFINDHIMRELTVRPLFGAASTPNM